MARILAIDFGTKRTGIAVTDPAQIIATGLDTIDTSKVLTYLEGYFKKEAVEKIVVGEPKQLDGKPSAIAPQVNAFVKQLGQKFPAIPVVRYDERFTSKMAFQAMIDGGLGKKQRQNKGLVDKVSAVILLQSYMDFANRGY